MRAHVKKCGGDLANKLDPSVSIICVSPSTSSDKLRVLAAQCAPTEAVCLDVGWIPRCVRATSLVAPQVLLGSLPPQLSSAAAADNADSSAAPDTNAPASPSKQSRAAGGNSPQPPTPSPSRKRRSPPPPAGDDDSAGGRSPPGARAKEPRGDSGGGGEGAGGGWTGGWQDDTDERVLRWISDGFVPSSKVPCRELALSAQGVESARLLGPASDMDATGARGATASRAARAPPESAACMRRALGRAAPCVQRRAHAVLVARAGRRAEARHARASSVRRA